MEGGHPGLVRGRHEGPGQGARGAGGGVYKERSGCGGGGGGGGEGGDTLFRGRLHACVCKWRRERCLSSEARRSRVAAFVRAAALGLGLRVGVRVGGRVGGWLKRWVGG